MPPSDANKRPFYEPNASPGEIYKSIRTEDRDFEKGETKLVKSTVPAFVKFCKWTTQFIRPDMKARYSEEHREAIDFLGWDLKASEFGSAVSFTMFAGVGIALLIGLLLAAVPLIPDCSKFDDEGIQVCGTISVLQLVIGFTKSMEMALVYIFMPLLLIALFLINYVQRYPLEKAREEQIRALTYVPEIVGYMTMSMKLVPNLERAIEFAAEHGRGKIADDLRKMIWEVQLGFYNTLSEGLDAMAYRWGKFSDEFKRSLMMIRASVLEESESKRYLLLDRTVTEMLDSIKNKMENYARQLSQPSIMLFYLGVLLPLILIIILPIGSVFSGAPLARPEILILVYNILIPLGAFIFARNVVLTRPPTYEPPVVPDNHPGLPPKNKAQIGNMMVDLRLGLLVILLVCGGITLGLSQFGVPYGKDELGQSTYLIPPDPNSEKVLLEDNKPTNYFEPDGLLDKELSTEITDPVQRRDRIALERQRYFAQGTHDITPYKLVFGGLLTFGLLAYFYLFFSNQGKRKVQLETMQMETEFRDSLYILASRMGENKPVEEALQHTREFLPKTIVAERIYGKIVENISLLGMPLEAAVFDKTFGALRNIPSAIIKSSMKLLVDSVNLGVNVSARTLMSLSMQLTNQEKVTRMLSALVREVTSMMHTMVIFIAPIVLGITTSLQKVVMVTLSQIVSSQGSSSVTTSSSVSVPGLPDLSNVGTGLLGQNPEVFQTMVTPVQFVLIVAIYVIELVIIMTYYNTKIEEDNDVLFKINLAQSLPIAILCFIVSVLISNSVVGALGS